MKQRTSDIAVVGAGVIGLAIALAAARGGKRVVLFERDARAMGASIRNFGLVLPMSQPPGPLHDRALRSREIWLELANAINLYCSTAGLLALAHHEDEHRVLAEYVQLLGQENHGRRLLTRAQTGKLSSAVKTDGLAAALHSPTEVVVDPRQAIRKIPEYLNTFVRVPDMTIQERWHGTYSKHPSKTDNVIEPEPGVTLVNGLGGAGMTHAFALADEMAASRN